MTPVQGVSKTDLMYEITYNPSSFVPVKSPRASVQRVVEGKEIRNRMRINASDYYKSPTFFDLDNAATVVWNLVDGKRTVEEIAGEVKSKESRLRDDEDAVARALLFFADSGALVSEEQSSPRKRVRVVSSFITEVTLIWDSTRMLRAVHRIVSPFLRRSLLWASMGIILAGATVFAPRFGSILGEPNNFRILGSSVVGFLFFNFIILGPVILVHELSHGLALLHYSGRAGEVGTGLFYFGPMFYVDATGYWSLPRRQRIMMMWAGNLSTLLIGSVLTLSTLFIHYPFTIDRIVQVAAFWCFYTTLWNLAPPFETDGYHILADAVNMPSLREDGFAYVKSLIQRLTGKATIETDSIDSRKKRILLAYVTLSVSLVGYIAFSSLRFTSYMAQDVVTWTTKVMADLSQNATLSLGTLAVASVTIVYFGLTLSGYGVLVRNQIRKSLVRGLQFESVNDRTLSMSMYIPDAIDPRDVAKFQAKIQSIARRTSPNFSIGRHGPILHVRLKIGSTTLHLDHIKRHLTEIEERFSSRYEKSIVEKSSSIIDQYAIHPETRSSLIQILMEMVQNLDTSHRKDAKISLQEFFQRQVRETRYLLDSTLGRVWAVELPPLQQYELVKGLLPRLLNEDLVMTNLLGEEEEFKKHTVYGMDSLAQLASESASIIVKVLEQPGKYQLISFFEPVRGRLVFLGKTQRIEDDLDELAPLLTIHVWSGYLDNLLGDISLSLHALIPSLQPLPDDLSELKDGEVRALRRYFSGIGKFETKTMELLAESGEAVKLSKSSIKEVKTRFEPSSQYRIGQFDSVLALNSENLASIPYGIAEVRNLLKEGFSWLKNFVEPLEQEDKKREDRYVARKGKLVLPYTATSLVSLITVITGLLLLGVAFLLSALIVLAIAQGFWAVNLYLVRRSSKTVSRYPSTGFTQVVSSLYAFTGTLGRLQVGSSILNPARVLRQELLAKEKEKQKDIPVHAEPGSVLTPA